MVLLHLGDGKKRMEQRGCHHVRDSGNRWGRKRGPAREARAAGDNDEATAQRGPSDSATECARLAAPLDSPDPSAGATGNGLPVGSCDAAPDPAHRLQLC